MHKEIVKDIEGKEIEVEVMVLGFRLVKQLKAKYLKVDKIVPEGNGVKSMEGTFDYESLSAEAIEKGVKGINMDHLDPLEGDRIYNKYYAKYFNPNNTEEKK